MAGFLKAITSSKEFVLKYIHSDAAVYQQNRSLYLQIFVNVWGNKLRFSEFTLTNLTEIEVKKAMSDLSLTPVEHLVLFVLCSSKQGLSTVSQHKCLSLSLLLMNRRCTTLIRKEMRFKIGSFLQATLNIYGNFFSLGRPRLLKSTDKFSQGISHYQIIVIIFLLIQ